MKVCSLGVIIAAASVIVVVSCSDDTDDTNDTNDTDDTDTDETEDTDELRILILTEWCFASGSCSQSDPARVYIVLFEKIFPAPY